MATTPYSLILLVAGYAVAAAGLALLVRQLRRVDWLWVRCTLRVWWSASALDAGLRAAWWLLPGTGVAVVFVINGTAAGIGVTVLLWLVLVVVPTIAATWLVLWLFACAFRRKSPRAKDVARPARGNPVASPAAVGGWGGGATAVFPQVSTVSRTAASGYRAGRVGTPLGSAGPLNDVRLEGAPVTAPRRVRTAAATNPVAVPVPAPCRGHGAGTPPTPGHASPRAEVARWAGLKRDRDQTAVSAPVCEQQTETWQRPAGLTAGR